LASPHALDREYRFYQLLLERIFGKKAIPAVQEVFDIGCRNWSYVQALADFFPDAKLRGIEIDGWRRYWNLYRRIDLAKAYCHALQLQGREATASSMDFLHYLVPLPLDAQCDQSTVFTFFYPFVSENPCLKCGLPAQYADFSALIAHSKKLALSQLKSTLWVSSHQGEWEAEIARKIYLQQGFEIEEKQVLTHEFEGLWPSSFPVFLFLATQPSQSPLTG
jgi:hypothetical protein